ncbi:esterase/lipase family protein [Prescottella agglutinans]|uniref:Triacylglycerol esterase/lipase EstA (Alpha/beta hydrolase family) n=1 Tax=Prescottella agglutinans TaxID=1644129 RepID=A0ABT6M499_9NOCA|nr:alpha/beta fold hydrolase [Prescottella agglutinans]MDH6279133.1 triacylglycerol esterase/lipase EstA (alpha/beta hydrolase family) [Prescottella agglutinans]
MVLRRRRLAILLATAAAVLFGAVGLQPATATADPAPGSADLTAPVANQVVSPEGTPAGSNDWSCRPSPQHPRPVVLVHGTGMSMQETWGTVSPVLRNEGYCVFALNYGVAAQSWGSGDIRNSARELAGFVDTVRARTGAAQVDIVGHSQGGTMARQYLRFEGGADPADRSRNKVHGLVMLGPTTHGTTFNGQQSLIDTFTSLRVTDERTNEVLAGLSIGLASYQQLIGSRFLADLNAGGETMPGIAYTVIASRTDAVVTPPEGSFLVPGAGSVRNEWVQDSCPGATVSHVGLTQDPRATFLVRRALDPSTPGSAPC